MKRVVLEFWRERSSICKGKIASASLRSYEFPFLKEFTGLVPANMSFLAAHVKLCKEPVDGRVFPDFYFRANDFRIFDSIPTKESLETVNSIVASLESHVYRKQFKYLRFLRNFLFF